MPPSPRPKTYQAYGLHWPSNRPIYEVIRYLVQNGGYVTDKSGVKGGADLFTLYRDMQTVLWPTDDHHEWSDLMLKTILDERITTVMGGKDSGKTHGISKFALIDYLCFPDETMILMSSTDIRGLELRVWGDLKDLFTRAKEVWPDLPGNPVNSLHGIFSDVLDDTSNVRDMRKGIICIPMLSSSGQWQGLEKYTGLKQKRRRLLGDECQFMESPYLTALANLDKGDFKGVFVGNPIGEEDPLDKLAEPKDGWDSLPENRLTNTWKNRFNGTTINLVGFDSPGVKNPEKFPYLINQKDIDRIKDYWGEESAEYWNQAAGMRRPGVSQRRVVTRDMVQKFGAQSPAIWRGSATTKVYAIDAGYGGDRCVAGHGEFGLDVDGKIVLELSEPRVVPIKVWTKNTPEDERVLPEDQIADFVKSDCERLGIPAANVFHDATGRGSLGSAFARLWRHDTNPIEFGGVPTMRPVYSDLFIHDEKLRKKRLKRCDEHYSKKVTELWFSVRYSIEAGQLRGLTESVLHELCSREWKRVKGDKIELETKQDTKDRLGKSPDKGDWAAIVVEGARQLGFQIGRLSDQSTYVEADVQWKQDFKDRANRIRNSYSLTHA